MGIASFFSVLGKGLKVAGKWAINNPDATRSVIETGVGFVNSRRSKDDGEQYEATESNVDRMDVLEEQIQQLREECDNNNSNINDSILELKRSLLDLQNDIILYRKKTNKILIAISSCSAVGIIVSIVLSIVL